MKISQKKKSSTLYIPSYFSGLRFCCRVTGLSLGSSEVRLRDRNVAPEDSLVKPPTGELHVVEPARIAVKICR